MMGWNAPFMPAGFSWMFIFIALDLVLRGISLWRSARKEQKIWFVALLLVSSFGILPAIYLLLNRDSKPSKKKK